jgi:uncharacterized protein YodC (DUF2158 family)
MDRMKIDTFQIGEVVTLNSGGPKMTVFASDEQSTTVFFLTEGMQAVQKQEIPTVLLKRARDRESLGS